MCGSQPRESQMLPFLTAVGRKVNQLYYMPCRHRGEVELLPYPFSTLALKGVGGQLNMNRLLHTHETDTVSTVQEPGWALGPAWIGLVNLTPQEFEHLTLQYVGSCYIYYTILPPLHRKPSNIKSSSCLLQLLPTQTLILFWSWLSVKVSSIPSCLSPLHANFLFSLSSNPL